MCRCCRCLQQHGLGTATIRPANADQDAAAIWNRDRPAGDPEDPEDVGDIVAPMGNVDDMRAFIIEQTEAWNINSKMLSSLGAAGLLREFEQKKRQCLSAQGGRQQWVVIE